MREYSLEIINKALSNPTGTTAMPGRIFCTINSNVDNMRILYDLILMRWVHPDTRETLDAYAREHYEHSLNYINWLKNPSSIPHTTQEEIVYRVHEVREYYEYDEIIDNTKEFFLICGGVLAGIGLVACYNAASEYLYDDN